MPDWVTDGTLEYTRRMPRQIQIGIEEIPSGQRNARGRVAAAREQEAVLLRKKAASADLKIVLDERGRSWTSMELAEQLRGWLREVPHVAMMVGGPDGFTDDIRDEADRLWSLSGLTLPHGLVRVVLAEQLYRAWTIIDGHPYHRRGR